MAGSTGLEPAASGVTGRRSNQLNYDPALGPAKPDPAVTAWKQTLVGGAGFEPTTPCV